MKGGNGQCQRENELFRENSGLGTGIVPQSVQWELPLVSVSGIEYDFHSMQVSALLSLERIFHVEAFVSRLVPFGSDVPHSRCLHDLYDVDGDGSRNRCLCCG